MSNSKKTLRFFTIIEWDKEEEYLRSMHKSGWKFESFIPPYIFSFSRCEPEDYIYKLDYNDGINKDRNGYLPLFEECGWEYIQSSKGFNYFRKPLSACSSADEDIFTDEDTFVETIGNMLKQRILLMSILLVALIIPNMLLNFRGGGPAGDFIRGVLLGFLIAYILIIVAAIIKYNKIKNKMAKK